MVTGYKTRKKRLRGTMGACGGGVVPHGTKTSSVSGEAAATFPKGEGCGRERRVYDVWYTPTVKDVYAQFKVAEQMLSRCNDPALAHIKRKVYEVEDLIWQFIGG